MALHSLSGLINKPREAINPTRLINMLLLIQYIWRTLNPTLFVKRDYLRLSNFTN